MPHPAVPSLILCLPFAAGLVVFALGGRGRRAATWLMTGTALVCLLLSLWLYPAIADGGVVRQAIPWAP